jgi:hypothetical protein
MERNRYVFTESFFGNWEIFRNALKNQETKIIYDMDLVLADSPKVVFKRFTEKYSEKYGIKVDPIGIELWDYLTDVATRNKFTDEEIKHAEDDWYNPEVLSKAPRYLYTKPLVDKTINYYGAENNYVLTSREPYLKGCTLTWFNKHFPKILKNNILIREDPRCQRDLFKVTTIRVLSSIAPWTVFVDDSTMFTNAVLRANIPNCLVVNIPSGFNAPNIEDDRFFVVKSYPERIHGMYTLLDAVNRATSNY